MRRLRRERRAYEDRIERAGDDSADLVSDRRAPRRHPSAASLAQSALEGGRPAAGRLERRSGRALRCDRLPGARAGPAETLAYLLREHPTYPAFEAWIRAKIGVPDAATLAKIRTALLERRPPWAARRRAELGIDDPSVDTSALLNDLEEWSLVHDALAAEREA